MEGVEARSLAKEISETVLLLAIAGFTLAGYLGIAFVFVNAIR